MELKYAWTKYYSYFKTFGTLVSRIGVLIGGGSAVLDSSSKEVFNMFYCNFYMFAMGLYHRVNCPSVEES